MKIRLSLPWGRRSVSVVCRSAKAFMFELFIARRYLRPSANKW